MSTLTAAGSRVDVRARLERLSAALPLLTIFVWLCLIYGWEAWGNLTPWVFGDELEHTQLSRAIAATGHAARRGEAHSPDSLYSYLIAPAWWIDNTHYAYGMVKAIGVVVMTASIFPTYALARLLVSRRAALLAATAAAAIPALAYSSLILQETLAYTWSIMCIWLGVRAFVTPTRSWIGATVFAALLAPTVRGELVVIPVALVLAYAIWWFIGERGRAWRRGWGTWDWIGFTLLSIGAVILFNSVASRQSQEWLISTRQYKGRLLDNGLWAGGALAIGLGVLPLVAGLAALFPGRWSAQPRAERAFLCVAATTLLGFGWYTAVKAAYLSTVFSTLVEERNLIYAAPILLVATALFFERRRTHPIALVLAGAFGFYVIVRTPYRMDVHFYLDAPGLSIVQSANRVLSVTPGQAQSALLVLLGVCVAVVAAVAFVRIPRIGAVLVGSFLFVLAWNLTGQIAGARSSHVFGDQLLSNLPRPLNWIDQETHGDDVVYYGQRVSQEFDGDPNGLWELEFWNRSLQGVWTVDGSGVGPGPFVTPDVLKPSGEIRVIRKFDYAVADEGIDLVGNVVASKQHLAGGGIATWTLYRIHPPMRLRHNIEGILADGWTTASSSEVRVATSAYSQFSTPENRRGFLVVHVSRSGGGKTLPANVRVRLGELVIGSDTQPALGKVDLTRTAHVDRDLDENFVLEAPKAPFRAEVRVWPTFSPSELDPNNSDRRQLGAQVSYEFVPRVPLAEPGRPSDRDGIFADRWIGASASYTRWSTPGQAAGTINVRVSRESWQGANVPGRVEIVVGRLGYRNVGGQLQLALARTSARRVIVVPKGEARVLALPAPRPPFRVELHASPLFVPAEVVPGSADTRELAARVRIWFSRGSPR